MTDDVEVWGEREAVIDRAAREIMEDGVVAVDTFVTVQQWMVASHEVAARMDVLTQLAEESD